MVGALIASSPSRGFAALLVIMAAFTFVENLATIGSVVWSFELALE